MTPQPYSALLCGRAQARRERPSLSAETSAGPLDQAAFAGVVANAPLIAIDLIIDNGSGKVLLGLRRNAPARDCWFVPGGRIYKNESLHAAFLRISRAETGCDMQLHNAQFKGVFEHFYDDNFAGAPGFGTHYVTLAYRIQAAAHALALLPQLQHAAYCWMSISEMLTMPDVHPNTKAYFF